MDIKTLGVDLAKNVFQICGLDNRGKVVLEKRLYRDNFERFVGNLPPCLIGMEACGSANYWARKFQGLGHTVKLMAPQFVKPYVKSNKNDYRDAEAIAEAVIRPTMRFVPIKNTNQQGVQSLHRTRSLLIKHRGALCNHIRGTLLEFGIPIALGISHIRKGLTAILEDETHELPQLVRDTFGGLKEQLKTLDKEIEQYDKQIEKIAKENKLCRRVQAIPGVGPLTATAIVAAVGSAKEFKNGREMAAWLGLVPRQCSSGNKTRLLGISKRGDRYLRTLLIHGARSAVRACANKEDYRSQWIQAKRLSGGENKAAVALANKNARILWALLSTGEDYREAA